MVTTSFIIIIITWIRKLNYLRHTILVHYNFTIYLGLSAVVKYEY
jgi:hypothetical protein